MVEELEGDLWWDRALVDRCGVGVVTDPPRLPIMAPLFASVSRNETKSSEKL